LAQGPEERAFRLGEDKFHANTQGIYLLGCVWFEFFYGTSVVGNPFVPKASPPGRRRAAARAHRVVSEKHRPVPLP
jgi:hypothetical protein